MGDAQPDPSMEEILASIKRVIAEDNRVDAPAARASRQVAPPHQPDPEPEPRPAEEDVLELDDPVSDEDGLMSQDAAAASRAKLAALTALRRTEEAPAAAGGPLEEAVRDMLRPMLKEWLDRNLPEIVEQLVAREVARITGRDL